jgi:hypothetical protein
MGLYLLPASQDNVNDSITKKVSLSVAERFMGESNYKALCARLEGESGFYCWAFGGSRKSLFTRMEPGDLALLTIKDTGRFNYRARVIHKCFVPDMGESIWGYRPGKPWEYIFFLTDISSVSIWKPDLVVECGCKPNYTVPGAHYVNAALVPGLETKFGSLDKFIRHMDAKDDFRIESD